VAALGTGFDHIGQFIIGATAGTVEVIQGGIQSRLVIAGEQTLNQPAKFSLPEFILQAAA